MMEKLTREQAIEEHRKMWNWIADETLKQKRKVNENEYFQHINLTDIPKDNSFISEYIMQQMEITKTTSIDVILDNFEYGKQFAIPTAGDSFSYCDHNHYQNASIIAREIANLYIPIYK